MAKLVYCPAHSRVPFDEEEWLREQRRARRLEKQPGYWEGLKAAAAAGDTKKGAKKGSKKAKAAAKAAAAAAAPSSSSSLKRKEPSAVTKHGKPTRSQVKLEEEQEGDDGEDEDDESEQSSQAGSKGASSASGSKSQQPTPEAPASKKARVTSPSASAAASFAASHTPPAATISEKLSSSYYERVLHTESAALKLQLDSPPAAAAAAAAPAAAAPPQSVSTSSMPELGAAAPKIGALPQTGMLTDEGADMIGDGWEPDSAAAAAGHSSSSFRPSRSLASTGESDLSARLPLHPPPLMPMNRMRSGGVDFDLLASVAYHELSPRVRELNSSRANTPAHSTDKREHSFTSPLLQPSSASPINLPRAGSDFVTPARPDLSTARNADHSDTSGSLNRSELDKENYPMSGGAAAAGAPSHGNLASALSTPSWFDASACKTTPQGGSSSSAFLHTPSSLHSAGTPSALSKTPIQIASFTESPPPASLAATPITPARASGSGTVPAAAAPISPPAPIAELINATASATKSSGGEDQLPEMADI